MGYDSLFIQGFDVPLPTPTAKVLEAAFSRHFIDHTRHSVLFNEQRGFAFVTAHNIAGDSLPDEQYTRRDFEFDPKIDTELQVGNERGYKDSPDRYQRGHLTRRASMSWGTTDDEIAAAKRAERESDYYSNIAPQDKRMHHAWGRVEDWMLELTGSARTEQRACVFQGPVFTDQDTEMVMTEGYDPILVPAGFWKVIAINYGGDLRAASFLIWQSDYATPEPLKFAPVLEQVRLTTIEVLTGLAFPSLRGADAMIYAAERRLMAKVKTMSRRSNPTILDRVRNTATDTLSTWTKSVFLPSGGAKPPVITGPEDIII